ncbi:MAG: hypothetical protein ABI980_12305 [Nitrospirota bacterium]
MTIAPSHCRLDIDLHSLIRQTQIDRKLISRVSGSWTHDCCTIQRNIKYDAQSNTFNSQPPIASQYVKIHGRKVPEPEHKEYVTHIAAPIISPQAGIQNPATAQHASSRGP